MRLGFRPGKALPLTAGKSPPPTWKIAILTLLLFVIWSNSFIAMSFLVGGEAAEPRLNFVSYAFARFVPASLLCSAYLLMRRRRECRRMLANHWARLALCGFLVVPVYQLCLAHAQELGVPASMASLATALNPLFIMTLSTVFLSERMRARHLAGLLLASAGVFIIGSSDRGSGSHSYSTAILFALAAPLSWSIFSVASKPVMREISPFLWSCASIAAGGAMLLPLAGTTVFEDLGLLDPAGWGAIAYLSLGSTVFAFALWAWLLEQLPATTAGFTIFLNPPLTVLSKAILSTLLPTVFIFDLRDSEWIGGLLVLTGMALALAGARTSRAGLAA